MEAPKITECQNKCYSCGKTFKLPKDYERHKKRKTPCLIREVPPDQINNPNRCIFCNKIFTQPQTLTRHLKVCKIKNGGMEILVDKVRYEHEIRILKEQASIQRQLLEQEQQKNKKLEEKFIEHDQGMQHMMKEIDKLKASNQLAITPVAAPPNNNNIVNNAPINIANTQVNNNQQIHYHINNYDSPNLDGLIFSLDEIAKSGNMRELALEKIYFNPDKPENHSLYISNKKEKDIVAFRNSWGLHQGTDAEEIAIIAVKKASDVCMNNCMHYEYGGMKEFMAAPKSTQEVVRDFARSVNDIPMDIPDIERHPIDSFYHIAISRREVVRKTIKDSGCKLIK